MGEARELHTHCRSCEKLICVQNGRVSPRTNSGASDKASRASASPLHMTSHASNMASKNESPGLGGGGGVGEPRESPKAAKPKAPADGHSASMEGAVGVPYSIAEGDEPAD